MVFHFVNKSKSKNLAHTIREKNKINNNINNNKLRFIFNLLVSFFVRTNILHTTSMTQLDYLGQDNIEYKR